MPILRDNRPLLLDTHVWLWLILGNSALAPAARDAINRAVGRGVLRIASISIWEVALLAARGRIILGKPTLEWVEEALVASSVELEPLSSRIVVDSCELPGGFHGDPADRIIVASARALNAAIVSRDKRILDYALHGHVAALAA